jgi:hypothetical protein
VRGSAKSGRGACGAPDSLRRPTPESRGFGGVGVLDAGPREQVDSPLCRTTKHMLSRRPGLNFAGRTNEGRVLVGQNQLPLGRVATGLLQGSPRGPYDLRASAHAVRSSSNARAFEVRAAFSWCQLRAAMRRRKYTSQTLVRARRAFASSSRIASP